MKGFDWLLPWKEEMGLLERFWRSNALNEIGSYHCLNEKAL